MDVLNDHIKQAQQELEAAEHSLRAARAKYDREGGAANAAFVRDAEVGYQHAQAEYERAVAAQQGAGGAPAVSTQTASRRRVRVYHS